MLYSALCPKYHVGPLNLAIWEGNSHKSMCELFELLHNSDDDMSVCAFMTYQ